MESQDANNVYYSTVDKKVQKGSYIAVKDPKKVGEGRDSYISYLVEVDGHGVQRRYSEFEALREALVRLNPTCVLPSLPEKLPVAMATMGNKASEVSEVIEKRRRRLESFLNRLASHPIISAHRLFLRFLESPTWSLEESEKTQNQTGFFSSLTVTERKVQKPDPRFVEMLNKAHQFGQHTSAVDRGVRKFTRRHQDLASDLAELGSIFNEFSLSEKELGPALEKCGAALDNSFLASRFLVSKLEESFNDPWEEHILYVDAIKAVLAKRDQQQAAVEGLVEQANSKRTQLSNLEAEANGVKVETTMFKSFTSSFSKMIDSNPQQTRKDNMTKLQTAIGQLDEEAEKANTNLVKSSEAIVFDVSNYEETKTKEMKELMAAYVKAQIEYYQKTVQAWGFVIPELEAIPERT